ncbi:unnamed protein product [Cuscuta campestris]|uniref:Uncharacterized protein n=1 Tax=Cuscuta campestris TaxID=132261 RepID=A0A484L266_9ASTE|nr:unnamed protein product [Cuscuta campestris]
MEFGFDIVGSSGNGMSFEAPVETSSVGFAKYLQQDPSQPNDSNDPLVAMVNQAWYHNNYLTINYILEGLAETLYPVYAGAKLAKKLWNSLNKKYQAEDAGTKKFIAGKMLDYKMVDNKSVVAQAEELTVIFNKCNEEKVGVSAAFFKWRPSFTNFHALGNTSKLISS